MYATFYATTLADDYVIVILRGRLAYLLTVYIYKAILMPLLIYYDIDWRAYELHDILPLMTASRR